MTERIRILLASVLLALCPTLACSDDDGGGDEGASGPDTSDPGDESGEDPSEGEGEEGDPGEGEEEGGDVDNVAACEDLIDALECGTVDLSQSVPCEQYASLACDLVDYFTCLEDNFTCTDGVFDPTSWTMCAELASCG